jgi:hypothetical protein
MTSRKPHTGANLATVVPHAASTVGAWAAASSRPAAAAASAADDSASYSGDEFDLPEGDGGSVTDEDQLFEEEIEVGEEDGAGRAKEEEAKSAGKPTANSRKSTLHISTVKRGLGDLRADSLYYSSASIGVGIGALTSSTGVGRASRMLLGGGGPQAVVLCDRSRDRRGHEKALQAARLASLAAEEARRAEAARETAFRATMASQGHTALRERAEAHHKEEARIRAEVRAAGRAFELRAKAKRARDAQTKAEAHDRTKEALQTARQGELAAAKTQARADALNRELNRRKLLARKTMVQQENEAYERLSRADYAVTDPARQTAIKAGEDEEEEEEEATKQGADTLPSPRKISSSPQKPSGGPPSPHRPPSRLHSSRAVALDSNLPGQRSPRRHEQQQQQQQQQDSQPQQQSAPRPSATAAAASSFAWTGPLSDTRQVLAPRRDNRAAQKRAEELQRALEELERRAAKQRNQAAKARAGRVPVRVVDVPGERTTTTKQQAKTSNATVSTPSAAAAAGSSTARPVATKLNATAGAATAGHKPAGAQSARRAPAAAAAQISAVDSGTMD